MMGRCSNHSALIMKLLRILAKLVILFVLLGLAFVVSIFWIPSIPTFIANRVIASVGGISGSIERISLDINGIELRNLRVRQEDGPGVELASAEIRYRLFAIRKKELRIDRLEARGIVLDLRQLPPSSAEAPPPAEPFEFEGIFPLVRDTGILLWLDLVTVEGRFLLPDNRSGTFHLEGGKIAPHATGQLNHRLVLDFPPDDASGLNKLEEHTSIAISQDGGGLNAVNIQSETVIRSSTLRTEGRIAKTLDLRQVENAETIHAALRTPEGNEVASKTLIFHYPHRSIALSAFARIDDMVISAWGLEEMLPAFLLESNAQGSIQLADFSGSLQSELLARISLPPIEGQAPLPEIRLDLGLSANSDGTLASLEELKANLSLGETPAVTVRLPQALRVRLDDPLASLPARSVLAEMIIELPLGQILPGMFASGQVDGHFRLSSLEKTLEWVSVRPFSIRNLALADPEAAFPVPISLSLAPALQLSETDFALVLDQIQLSAADRPLAGGAFRSAANLDFEQTADALPFSNLTADGELELDLKAVWDLLLAGSPTPAQQGTARVQLRAGMSDSNSPLKADLTTRIQGITTPDGKSKLEAITVSLESKIDPSGSIVISGPLQIHGPSGRTNIQNELEVYFPDATGTPLRFSSVTRAISVYVDDLMLLAEVFALPETDSTAEETTRHPPSREPDKSPLWSGIEGTARAEFARIVLGTNAITNLKAAVRVDQQAIELSEFSARFGSEPMLANFKLQFTGSPSRPYLLNGGLSLKDFDLSSLDREIRGRDKPALLEGIFHIDAKIRGRGPNLETIAEWLEGDFAMEARSATFYPLGGFAFGDSASALVGQLGGFAAGLLMGREQAGYAAAVQELVALMQGVQTDQLRIQASLREGMDVEVKRFELLAPQISFIGSGRIPFDPEKSFFEQNLNLNLEIGAKGNAAHAFNQLRLLKGTRNPQGYFIGPSYENAGPLGSPTSTLGDLLRGSLTGIMSRQPVDLPDLEIDTPPPREENEEDPLQQLRNLFRGR